MNKISTTPTKTNGHRPPETPRDRKGRSPTFAWPEVVIEACRSEIEMGVPIRTVAERLAVPVATVRKWAKDGRWEPGRDNPGKDSTRAVPALTNAATGVDLAPEDAERRRRMAEAVAASWEMRTRGLRDQHLDLASKILRRIRRKGFDQWFDEMSARDLAFILDKLANNAVKLNAMLPERPRDEGAGGGVRIGVINYGADTSATRALDEEVVVLPPINVGASEEGEESQ